MKLPSFIYRSERVGKNGKVFSLYKLRTLKEDFRGNFANKGGYTKFGKFLRKTKLDEFLQIINVLKGEMSLVGPRPELPETINLIPKDIRKILLSVKPGCTSLASVHFYDEEFILQQSGNQNGDYYSKIKPMKILLDVFYVQHRSFLLKLAILWETFKLVIKSF
jgi:lipopolysaccharide/colanic/teichoic acid biosynthesis glycosyltransferase